MKTKPHEDPNCKCKACEAWAEQFTPTSDAWANLAQLLKDIGVMRVEYEGAGHYVCHFEEE